METTFSTKDYIKELGNELVHEFNKAGMTTHPHAVGTGREISAKKKLKSILPAGIGIGSGFVIDSFGNTSKQCDIILYEEAFALKFILNDNEDYAYYNCESVIAVGEVKSDASSSELKDAINKLAIIKGMKRQNRNGYNTRKYFTSTTVTHCLGELPIPYSSQNDGLKQIYTFLLCRSLNVPTEKVLKYIKERCNELYMYPNSIVSTKGTYISYIKQEEDKYTLVPSRNEANLMYNLVDNDYTFNYFIHNLLDFISAANTVPLNYNQYLSVPLSTDDLKEKLELKNDRE